MEDKKMKEDEGIKEWGEKGKIQLDLMLSDLLEF